MLESFTNAYHDVLQYPAKYLQIESNRIRLPVTYKKSWDDGFGARGWKIDASIDDPQIIASTRETGQRINTSVFVHDILDHYLSGFGISGHRSEAMALIQLSKRTGASPTPDYKQIIDEDILHGRINGESMRSFLPNDLIDLLPLKNNMTDREIISFLKNKTGKARLNDILVRHFYCIGKAGENHASVSWKKSGLDPAQQTDIGLALQELLVQLDSQAEKLEIEELKGFITINKNHVAFKTNNEHRFNTIGTYQTAIAG